MSSNDKILKIILCKNIENSDYDIKYERILPKIKRRLEIILNSKFSEYKLTADDNDKELLNILDFPKVSLNSSFNTVLNIYIKERQRQENVKHLDFYSLFDLFPEVKDHKSHSLFLKNNKNKIVIWQACIKNNKIFRRYGYIDGAIKETSKQIYQNLSQRSIEEQCLLELSIEIKKKMDCGYSENPSIIEGFVIRPMLANIYHPSKIKNWPVIVQPKLDGIRCFSYTRSFNSFPKSSNLTNDSEDFTRDFIYSDNSSQNISQNTSQNTENIILKSRENNIFPQDFSEIKSQLRILFHHLPPSVLYLDGELYCEEDFYILASIVKTFKKHEKADLVKYYIFDVILKENNKSYYERYDILLDALINLYNIEKSNLKINLVYSHIAKNDEEVQKYFRIFREKKFEGIIIRDPNSFYRHTRCNDMLKLKEFYDEECEIIDITEGEGTDKGLAIFEVRDKEGNNFKVRPKANRETRSYWFKNKTEIIGKKCTVKYFKKNEEGNYIMPVAYVRDYE